MRHREVDRARPHLLRPGLRPPRDLDLAPCETDAAAERLADRLLGREARRVVLRRVPAAFAVRAFGLREAARREVRVALERAPDALDLDQIYANAHWPRF